MSGWRWPASLSAFRALGSLGGSTGAQLVEDENGQRYVFKWGADAERVLEEACADAIYRTLGVPVPDTKIYEDEHGAPVRVARIVEGVPVGAALKNRSKTEVVREQLRRAFAADALLAKLGRLRAASGQCHPG